MDTMKAAIALLTNNQVQNYARRIVFELQRESQIDFLGSLLPAHVSLKQPFAFEDMVRLEGYFDSLAAQIRPFQIVLDEIYYTEWEGYGILGLNVVETDILRELHNQLNRELRNLFVDTSAPHDGAGYKFHMTIELGRIDKENPYQAFFEQLADRKVDMAFQTQEIALFYYTGRVLGSYFCYKVLPLTG